MYENYLNKILELLEKAKSQEEPVKQAASLIAEAMIADKLIHVTGCGHSQMFAHELWFRAGGLVPINAILPPVLSTVPYAPMSTYAERQHGLAKIALDAEKEVNEGDVIIIASASGRNAVPIEFALEAKNRGLKTIGLTSLEFTNSVTSRHESGYKLADVVDVVLDIGGAVGDSTISIPNSNIKTGATSSIIGFAILNTVIAEAIEKMIDLGGTPKVWTSVNAEGAAKLNDQYVKDYWDRITLL